MIVAYGWLSIPAPAHDKKRLKAWCEKRKDKKLYELQIETCQWAIAEIPAVAELTGHERRRLTDLIQAEIDWLRRTEEPTAFHGLMDLATAFCAKDAYMAPAVQFVAPPPLAPDRGMRVELARGVAIELVSIPAGSFMMGDERGEKDEKPVHKVTITKPFYVGRFAVTQEEWQAVMGGNPSHCRMPKMPVENVSWDECQEFSNDSTPKCAIAAGFSGCQRRRNGNTRAGPEARVDIASATTRACLETMPGSRRTPPYSRTPLRRRN